MRKIAHERSGRRRIICLVLSLALGLGAGAALAQPRRERPPLIDVQSDVFPAQRGQISLQQAVEMATRRYPGRVVRADTTTRNGRVVHEIRILGEDSRVRTVHIDAQSGDQR